MAPKAGISKPLGGLDAWVTRRKTHRSPTPPTSYSTVMLVTECTNAKEFAEIADEELADDRTKFVYRRDSVRNL
jgi:hypothetical protein